MKKVLLLSTLLFFSFSSCGTSKKVRQATLPAVQEVPATRSNPRVVSDSLDVAPKFQEGDPILFHTWVMKRVKYPVDMIKKGISGRVTAAFIVDENGLISEIEILGTPHEDLSTEVVRVILTTPPWTPGLKDGRPVKARMTIPFEFRLGVPRNTRIIRSPGTQRR